MPKLCNSCTFENHDLMSACEMCEAPFAAPADVKTPMFNCPSCRLDNALTSSHCTMCDTTFPHALAEFAESECDVATELDHLTALTLHFKYEDENKLVIPSDNPADYIKCPYCAIDINIAALACTIFICGATASGQLNQHNEAAAQAAVARGDLPAALPGSKPQRGCGRQFQVKDGVPIPCTGR